MNPPCSMIVLLFYFVFIHNAIIVLTLLLLLFLSCCSIINDFIVRSRSVHTLGLMSKILSVLGYLQYFSKAMNHEIGEVDNVVRLFQ